MLARYWSAREDICLGVNEGWFSGRSAVAEYYAGQEERIAAESAMIQAAFPKELGEKSAGEVHGVGMIDYKPVDTGVIEVAGDGQTAKGLWMIRGSYSKLTSGGPAAYWEWSWLAIDFVREAGEWKIWHQQYLREIDRPCGYPWVGEEHAFQPRDEFAGAEGIREAAPNVAAPLRKTYSAHRPFTPSPEVPVPYDTFAHTFSYGLDA